MRSYIKNNKYLIVNQLLNQFGGAMMGLVLSAAVGRSSNNWLILIVSLFSISFYLVLQYTSLWDAGAKDILRVEGRRLEYRPYAGFVMSIFANIPNFVIAVLVLIGSIFGDRGGLGYEWAGNISVVARFAGMFWEPMYNGLIQLYSPRNPIAFFLIPLPAMAAAGLGYFAGMKNFKIIRVKKKSSGK